MDYELERGWRRKIIGELNSFMDLEIKTVEASYYLVHPESELASWGRRAELVYFTHLYEIYGPSIDYKPIDILSCDGLELDKVNDMEKDYFSDGFVNDAEAFGCTGIVTGERTEMYQAKGAEGPALYYFLDIDATNYDGTLDRRIKLSDSRGGKWVPYLKQMKDTMKAAGFKYEKCGDAVGHEFKWKEKIVSSFERDGVQQQNKVLMPIEHLKAPDKSTQAKVDGPDLGVAIVESLKVSGPALKADIATVVGASVLDVAKAVEALVQKGTVTIENDLVKLK